VVVIQRETIDSVLADHSAVYVGGPAEDQVICFFT